MGVGEILSGSFAMLKSRFWPMLGMWLAYFGLSFVLMIVFGAVIGVSAMSGFAGGIDQGIGGLGAGFIVSLIVFYIGYILLALAQAGSLVAKATPLQDQPFGEALASGAPTMLLVFVLLMIGYVAGALILSLVGVALASLGTGGTIILALIAAPLLVFAAMRMSLLLPVAVVERQRNPITVIARSWALTQGRVLPILLAWLAYLAIFVVLCLALFVPVWGSLTNAASPPSGLMAVYLVFGFMAIFVLFSLAQSAMLGVIHAKVSGSTGVDVADTFA
jgi:hypothetical protein